LILISKVYRKHSEVQILKIRIRRFETLIEGKQMFMQKGHLC